MAMSMVSAVMSSEVWMMLTAISVLIPVFGYSTSSVYGGGRRFVKKPPTTSDDNEHDALALHSHQAHWQKQKERAELELKLLDLQMRFRKLVQENLDETLEERRGIEHHIRQIRCRINELR